MNVEGAPGPAEQEAMLTENIQGALDRYTAAQEALRAAQAEEKAAGQSLAEIANSADHVLSQRWQEDTTTEPDLPPTAQTLYDLIGQVQSDYPDLFTQDLGGR